MCVLSSRKVVESAEKIGRKILDTYLEPNKAIPELREMVASNSIDILGDFEEALSRRIRFASLPTVLTSPVDVVSRSRELIEKNAGWR
jgi:hypothetical protein